MVGRGTTGSSPFGAWLTEQWSYIAVLTAAAYFAWMTAAQVEFPDQATLIALRENAVVAIAIYGWMRRQRGG